MDWLIASAWAQTAPARRGPRRRTRAAAAAAADLRGVLLPAHPTAGQARQGAPRDGRRARGGRRGRDQRRHSRQGHRNRRSVPDGRDRRRRARQGAAPHDQPASCPRARSRAPEPAGANRCTVTRPGRSGWSRSCCSSSAVLALPNVFGDAPALQLSRNDRAAAMAEAESAACRRPRANARFRSRPPI